MPRWDMRAGRRMRRASHREAMGHTGRGRRTHAWTHRRWTTTSGADPCDPRLTDRLLLCACLMLIPMQPRATALSSTSPIRRCIVSIAVCDAYEASVHCPAAAPPSSPFGPPADPGSADSPDSSWGSNCLVCRRPSAPRCCRHWTHRRPTDADSCSCCRPTQQIAV